jgi:hypothetical protein
MNLYQELLDCTNEQRTLVEAELRKVEKEEDILPFFSVYFEKWNQIVEEIELVNTKLDADDVSNEERQQLQDMMTGITENITYVQDRLEVTSSHTGNDLRGVRNQQKVMNAYYNLNSKDHVPLYFDAKK